MTDWPERITRLSGFLLQLNALVENGPEVTFQTSALQAAQAALPFDSALWAVGSIRVDKPNVHGFVLLNQPAEMMADWERIKHLDILSQRTLSCVGDVVTADADGPAGGPAFDPVVRAHVRRYGMRQMASTVRVDPLSRLFTAISLYRQAPDAPFNAPDVVVARCLFEHLDNAWMHKRLRGLHSNLPQAFNRGSALADGQHVIHAASASFVAALCAEWPDWSGPALPLVLHRSGLTEHVGVRIVVQLKREGNMLHLHARLTMPLDTLTKRERAVAGLVAAGDSYRRVADRLRIAPDTVRSHLKNIYRKLDVTNKASLTQMLTRLEL